MNISALVNETIYRTPIIPPHLWASMTDALQDGRISATDINGEELYPAWVVFDADNKVKAQVQFFAREEVDEQNIAPLAYIAHSIGEAVLDSYWTYQDSYDSDSHEWTLSAYTPNNTAVTFTLSEQGILHTSLDNEKFITSVQVDGYDNPYTAVEYESKSYRIYDYVQKVLAFTDKQLPNYEHVVASKELIPLWRSWLWKQARNHHIGDFMCSFCGRLHAHGMSERAAMNSQRFCKCRCFETYLKTLA